MPQAYGAEEWRSKVARQLFGDKFQPVCHIIGRFACVAALSLQLGILDYFLVAYRSLHWLLWLIADVVVLLLFIITMIVSYRYLKMRPTKGPNQHPERHFGELWQIYVSWFVYSAVLSAKICCLYALPDSIALQLNEEYFFGPNWLPTAISLASLVVYLLVQTSYDARYHKSQHKFVHMIAGHIHLDLLDATEFLGTIRDESLVIYHMDKVVLAVACINFILPTEGLYVLSVKHFGKVQVSEKYVK